MIYELRNYRCVPGRLPALLSRFQKHTLRIWEKHGIRQAGFWTTLVGESSQQLTARLGQPGGARETLGGVSGRP
jgi:NIPSNAP